MLLSNLSISQEKVNQSREETEKDETLQLLSEYIRNGWPENRCIVVPKVKPYYNILDEITPARCLVLKSCLMIVPARMQKEMKKLIHQGHQGDEKCKMRARTSFNLLQARFVIRNPRVCVVMSNLSSTSKLSTKRKAYPT